MSRIKTEGPAVLLCMAVGVLISVLPHLIAWQETGSPAWIADHDERFYLGVGSQAYFNHPTRLTDPARAGDGPSLYKPLPLMPGIWAAWLLGLGPLGIGIAWRVWAGITIGPAWYILIRQTVAKPWVAVSLAVVLLSDGGLIEGVPIHRHVMRVGQIAMGREGSLFEGKPQVHPAWRISTPGLTMAYLLALIWAVGRARKTPSRGRIGLAGLTFGLLFYVYFYYWTAAGLALLITLALDAGHRRIYFHVGWIGGLIGTPSVIFDYLMKRGTSSDWLLRTDKFLPISHYQELIVPKLVALILALTLIWILIRRRDLILVWALGASGLFLTNHQIITGLQIENFHWAYVWGPSTALLVLLIVAEVIPKLSIGWTLGISVFAVLMFGTGFWLRAVEATRSSDARENSLALSEYGDQQRARRSEKLIPNAVVAGDPTFVDYAVILDNLRPLSNYFTTLSPTITNAEWEERMAVDGLLQGLNRSKYEALQRLNLELNRWGPWGRDPQLRDDRLTARLVAFDRIKADLPGFLTLYKVQYVALPTGARASVLTSGWTKIEIGPTWDLWERHDEP